MKLQKITLRNITASGQPRPLVTAEVDKLAASIKEVGLIQPITVREVVVIHGTAEQGWQIVAGHHRVAACRALGWTEIDALVIEDATHLQSELMEIDENLCRAELTASQRTSYTKRRKQIWEALNPPEANQRFESVFDALGMDGEQVGTDFPPVAKHGHAQEKGFAASTAEATGMTKRAINQQLARAKALGEEALSKVANTSLDSGVELDALAKMDAPERAQLIERAAAGEQVSARAQAPAVAPSKPAGNALPLSDYEEAIAAEDKAVADIKQMARDNASALRMLWRWGSGDGSGVLEIIAKEIGLRSPSDFPQQSTSAVKGKQVMPTGLRKRVFERDAYRCVHCATHIDLSIDHIQAESKGGTLAFENLQTLCRSCNSKKGVS